MDDLGSILYLVFTVLAVIFSIVKKSNQNKEKKSVTTDTTHEDESVGKDILEDIIPQLKGMFDKPNIERNTVEPNITKQKIITKPEPISSRSDYQFAQQKSTLNSSSKNSVREKVKSSSSEPKGKVVESSESWFNAREAIIYSEILKRPDF